MSKDIEEKKKERQSESSGIVLRIVRTIGFVLLAIGSGVIGVTTVIALFSVLGDSVTEYASLVNDMSDTINSFGIPNLIFISQIAVLLGLLILTFTTGKSFLGKILQAAATLLMLLYMLFAPNQSVFFLTTFDQFPESLATTFQAAQAFFERIDNFVSIDGLMGGIVTLAYVLITAAVLGKKRPKKFSASLVRYGVGTLTLLAVVHGILVPVILNFAGSGEIGTAITNFFTNGGYLIFPYSVLAISYVIQLFGSIIGTIFFFVK